MFYHYAPACLPSLHITQVVASGVFQTISFMLQIQLSNQSAIMFNKLKLKKKNFAE